MQRLRTLGALGVLAGVGCMGKRIDLGGMPGTLMQPLSNDVDVLFVIDDSSSMLTVQDNLAANFPAFMTALDQLPNGLPDIHIAVTTTSMGAGLYSSTVAGCL